MMSAAAIASTLASARGLALLLGQHGSDVAGTLAHQRGGLPHDLAALGCGHVAPGLEALARGHQRAVEVGTPGVRHAADLQARGRVDDRERAAIGGVLPGAVDEELGVGIVHGVSAPGAAQGVGKSGGAWRPRPREVAG
jgi:hypothetical protein